MNRLSARLEVQKILKSFVRQKSHWRGAVLMTRLYFYVEGQTEQAFVKRVLKPHLATFGVMVMGAILKASARSAGIIHRGGGNFAPARNDLLNLLKLHRGADVRFTTMFDLYALPSDFPGLAATCSKQHLPYERVKYLEEALSEDIADRRLIPHLQLFEFESILLADPTVFSLIYDNAEAGIAKLQAAVRRESGCPELVDDGPDTAPSKRIIQQFPRYLNGKTTDGVDAAECIPLPTVRACSPHFNQWLQTLESL